MINKIEKLLAPQYLRNLVPFKRAFTLAEVLITLGIIGVVAAMTIPALIQNYNSKTWKTAASVFDKKLDDAIKTMNSQSTLAGHATTESFIQELSKHFKINKICQNNELLNCFPKLIWWGGGKAEPQEVDISKIRKAKHFGQDDWKSNIIGVQFANGTSALIAYNPTETCEQDPYSNQIKSQSCLAILYDTSGYKNPNTLGKDLQSNENVVQLSGCAFEINGTCYTTTPFIPTPMKKDECEFTKNDLGIKNCQHNSDYWAGAVKTCGGVSKMPTMAQLAEIANFIYNTDKIQAQNSVSNISRDDTKALSLGFKFNTGSPFYIWSGEEYDSNSAYDRYFFPTYSNFSNRIRYGSDRYAICIE